MALDKLVLIVFLVAGSFAVAVWLGALILAALSVPFMWIALIPAAFVGYVVYRVIAERLSDPTENHYDKMDH